MLDVVDVVFVPMITRHAAHAHGVPLSARAEFAPLVHPERVETASRMVADVLPATSGSGMRATFRMGSGAWRGGGSLRSVDRTP